MKVFYALLLFPLLSFAVPENEVHPNSGPTDARTDQNTDIGQPSASPINQGTGTVQGNTQEMQERPGEDPNAMEVGPYDRDGNYIYGQKKP